MLTPLLALSEYHKCVILHDYRDHSIIFYAKGTGVYLGTFPMQESPGVISKALKMAKTFYTGNGPIWC